ncbi:uncharacterized protein LOC6563302 isoform X1 [Drosophila grimshawi]|uniref:uncharacterized protein LOC6563302 isoform X1 n=1 Tax=Drosophila grimshawi TaxID=7222 RepID=UPI0013EF2E3A|nr:uncharacterized protein LOC6563302 isoform X1 [Drosophila grimshawi]
MPIAHNSGSCQQQIQNEEAVKTADKYVCIKQFLPLHTVQKDGTLMYMVMIIKDISQPLKLSLLNKKSAKKHLSHVILVVRDAEKLSLGWMRASFRQFWTIWLLNVVIIYWRNDRLHIYRYNPFTNDFLQSVPLEQGAVATLPQLFSKQIPNMHRKPLRMCIFNDNVRMIYGPHGRIRGTDGLLSGYIAQRLNATRIITRPMSYLNNLSTYACNPEIWHEFDDVAMNIRFLVPSFFNNRIEATVANSRDDLCVIVPKATDKLLFWNIFRSFGDLVWLSIGFSLLLAYIFCRALYTRQPSTLALDLYCCTLAHPMAHVPRRRSMCLFLIFWLFFGMLISSAFRGNLTSMLIYRKPQPDINDLSELASSTYKILIRPRHIFYIKEFLATSQPHLAKIRQLMLPVSEEQFSKAFDSNDRRFAYLEKYHVAAFQVNTRQHMRLGQPQFHLMNNCLVPFHGVYIVPYGSPYLGYFNTLIRGAHEFGFHVYWNNIMNAEFIKSGTKMPHHRQHSSNSDDPVVLKLEHFPAVFFLWAIGIALSLIVFLWELLAHNWAIKKRRSEQSMQT